MTPLPRKTRTNLVFSLIVSVLLGAASAPAWAQADAACEPTTTPVFAGHNFGEGGVLEPGDFTTEDAYPSLPTGFRQAVLVTSAMDGSDRLFVVEQRGRVYAFDSNAPSQAASLFLDISSQVETDGEKGLLGLAFDPEFGNASSARFGEFYVYASVPSNDCLCVASGTCELNPNIGSNSPGHLDHCSNVIRYRAVAASGSAHPNQVVPSSREVVLEIEQPETNHNGGMLAFGPDDALYIASGDGGSGSNPSEPQDLTSLRGKILRIDPRGQSTYAIPSHNPFFGDPSKAREVLHYGLRNPWRMSFDRLTGDLWIGDVGASRWEEVNFVAANDPAAKDFGWPLCEGTHEQASFAACTYTHDRPAIELARPGSGGAIAGGYVYRGDAIPSLQGHYIFTEQYGQRFYRWDRQSVDPSTGLAVFEDLGHFERIVGFGEDEAGEILLPEFKSSSSGRVLRLAEIPGTGGETGSGIPEKLSETGLFSSLGAGSLDPVSGLIEYSVGSPLWSDGASKRRWFALPAGESIAFSAQGAWDFPVGSVLVKHFDMPHADLGTWRIETRVMLREESDWTGFTYRWNANQDDADLVSEEQVDDICLDNACNNHLTWNFPSPGSCFSCHTDAAGRVLGLRTSQVNHLDAAAAENQLRKLNCMKLFDTDVGAPEQYRSMAGLSESGLSTHRRARSYLASNCAHCHQPGTGIPGGMDLRFETPLSSADVVGVPPSIPISGVTNPEIVKIGDASNSILWRRQSSTDEAIRMAKLTLLRDASATGLQFNWISNLLVSAPDDDDDGVLDGVDNCVSHYNPDQLDYDNDGSGDGCDASTVPDLQAFAGVPSGFDYQLVPGESLVLAGIVSNLGTGPSAASQVRFFLSEDDSFQPELDPVIGECFVDRVDPNGEAYCADPDATVPTEMLSPGGGPALALYLGACSDGLELIAESNESNGCSVLSAPILVPEPGVAWNWFGLMLGGLGLARLERRRQRRAAIDSLER